MASPACAPSSWLDDPAMFNLRLDNDALGSPEQDQGYSNGLVLSVVSRNLAGATDPACVPWLARGLHRRLKARHPGEFEQQQVQWSLSHGLYTPDEKDTTELIEDDRPFAGVLMLGMSYNARNGDRLRTTRFGVGMVGPSAQGERVQRAVHNMIGLQRPLGWNNQLRDEPLLQLVHERMRRWPPTVKHAAPALGWDAIGHAGGSLGNFATHANVGAELRFGWRLRDDFGSTPLRPAGENTASASSLSATQGWAWHMFLGMDGRWVLRDITLDGNTFKHSHSVEKRPLVVDLGYGLVVSHGRWKVTLAQYQRTREFEGQNEHPTFGSLSVSRMF
jgi:hypothetical protein